MFWHPRHNVLVSILLLVPATSGAFSSVGQGAHHSGISREAAVAKGFPDSTSRLLGVMTEKPDVDENSYDFKQWKPVVNKNRYVASHHFDRNNNVTDANAFGGGERYMLGQKQLAIDSVAAGREKGAYAALGRCLHALEDCFSHSNFVDLSAGDQTAVITALFDSTQAPPATLWMTGYDPNAADDESPPGDPHPHRTMAKDWGDKNAESQLMIGGQTKFQLARAAAETQVESVLDMVKGAVTAAQWDAFRGIVAEPDPDLPEYGFECSDFCPSMGCNFGCYDPALSGDDLSVNVPSGALSQPDSLRLIGVPPWFFLTGDMLVASDGAQIIPGWEIRVGEFEESNAFASPASAVAAIPDSELAAFPGATWGVYYMDEASEDWTPVSGSTVDVNARQATFPVSLSGIYAVGHMPGATAVQTCQVAVDAQPHEVDVKWSLSLGAAVPFHVLRSSGGTAFEVVHEQPAAPGSAFEYRDHEVQPAKEYAYVVAYWDGKEWIPSPAVSTRTPATSLALHAPAPNPSRSGSTIEFEMPRAGAVTLDILDAQGRVVSRIWNGLAPAGLSRMSWLGRAANGNRVAAGAYFVRLRFEGQTLTRLVVVLAR